MKRDDMPDLILNQILDGILHKAINIISYYRRGVAKKLALNPSLIIKPLTALDCCLLALKCTLATNLSKIAGSLRKGGGRYAVMVIK